jgi:hypothetical protein
MHEKIRKLLSSEGQEESWSRFAAENRMVVNPCDDYYSTEMEVFATAYQVLCKERANRKFPLNKVQATIFGHNLAQRVMVTAKERVRELELWYVTNLYPSLNRIMGLVQKGQGRHYLSDKCLMDEPVEFARLRYDILTYLRIRYPVQIHNASEPLTFRGTHHNWPVQDELVKHVYGGLWKRLAELGEGVLEPTRDTRWAHSRIPPAGSTFSIEEDRWNWSEEMVSYLQAERLGYVPRDSDEVYSRSSASVLYSQQLQEVRRDNPRVGPGGVFSAGVLGSRGRSVSSLESDDEYFSS